MCSVKPVKTQQKTLQVQTSGYSWALWITSKAYNLVVKTISALCKGNLDLQVWDFPHQLSERWPILVSHKSVEVLQPRCFEWISTTRIEKVNSRGLWCQLKKRVEQNDPCLLNLFMQNKRLSVAVGVTRKFDNCLQYRNCLAVLSFLRKKWNWVCTVI